jgi:hypothetical protein
VQFPYYIIYGRLSISISNGHLPCCLLLFDSDYGPSTAATKIVEILKTIVIGGPKRNENEMLEK